ncbi:MAG: hypothetical protein KAV00_07355, partial [Phycisphaerae bacterium]|nr:hypothetical protein [Phycisphaerae bacterium]
MRKTTRMAVLCILWAVSTCAAAEPKLINEKRVFPKGDPVWKKPRQYSLWAMRLSPDGKHLLYSHPKGKPPLTPEGAPDFHKMQYEMVLRNLKTDKDTLLPINPLKSGWRTGFTRFNMFDPAGKKLALANIVVEEQKVDERLTSVRTSMTLVLYDITAGKIIKTSIKDPRCIGKFDRTGKGLIGMKGRRSLDIFTSDLGGVKLKTLAVKGFLQSVCPTA